MLVRYCTAVALKRHERVNAFNLVMLIMMTMLIMITVMVFSYGTMSGLDVRRKNATRESTSTLKAWLFQHIKNPYPTKGEKIMLAIVTRMTLTQVTLRQCSIIRVFI